MRRFRSGIALSAAAALLVSSTVAVGTSGSYPKGSFLYETDDAVRAIINDDPRMRALNWVFRIEPSTSGPGTTFDGGNAQRTSKYSGKALSGQTTAVIVQELKMVVDNVCPTPALPSGTCQAHYVLIDEIGNYFGGKDGKRSKAGQNLLEAMRQLDQTPSPWGGSYASRIHFALAPGPATSVAYGYGNHRTLGRDGSNGRRNYFDVFRAMSYGGGVWIEMYHYATKKIEQNTADEWRDVGVGVVSFLKYARSQRNPLDYTHFLFGNVTGSQSKCAISTWKKPKYHSNPDYAKREKQRYTEDQKMMDQAKKMAAKDSLTTVSVLPQKLRMDCDWRRAQNNAVNLRILSNGPAAISLSVANATSWGKWFRRWFVERI